MRSLRRSVTWKSLTPVVAVMAPVTIAALFWYQHTRPAALSEAEVRDLLAGNTIEGGWGQEGSGYRQYFAPDGLTLYAADEKAMVQGTWTTDGDGAVCTRFEDPDAVCFQVGRQNDGMLYWIDARRGRGYPFAVRSGKRLAPATSGTTSRSGSDVASVTNELAESRSWRF